MQMTTHLCRKRRRTKEPLDESEREEWKSWFKLNMRKMKFMASIPITSWQIVGNIMDTVRDFFFGGGVSKITTGGDCSHEIKRHLLLGRKAMINLDSYWASLVIQMVKNLPAVQESGVQSLGRDNPVEEHMATHSSILAWRIPMDRVAWRAAIH